MASTNLNDLPDEILEFIFGHMPPYRDLQSCALVCKRWMNIVRSKRIVLNSFRNVTLSFIFIYCIF